jgi:hypothetical protein
MLPRMGGSVALTCRKQKTLIALFVAALSRAQLMPPGWVGLEGGRLMRPSGRSLLIEHPAELGVQRPWLLVDSSWICLVRGCLLLLTGWLGRAPASLGACGLVRSRFP